MIIEFGFDCRSNIDSNLFISRSVNFLKFDLRSNANEPNLNEDRDNGGLLNRVMYRYDEMGDEKRERIILSFIERGGAIFKTK